MARIINIDVDQGTTFSTPITLAEANGSPIDLTTYTANGTFRKHYSSMTAYPMQIGLGGNTGVLTISVQPNATTNVNPGLYVYDVVLISNTGARSRIVEGNMYINPGVTL